MELELFWTKTARNNLKEIYEYYKFKASISIAYKLINEIIDKTTSLSSNPKIGQMEQSLIKRKKDFRYLVCKNYKIIYSVNHESHRIEIRRIFDCRLNPYKINEID
jgi:plasmid stabilization system protein ParE